MTITELEARFNKGLISEDEYTLMLTELQKPVVSLAVENQEFRRAMTVPNTLVNKGFTEMEFAHMHALLGQLEFYGAPTQAASEWVEARVERARQGPSEADLRWLVEPADTVTDHLAVDAANDARPALSCKLVVGRQYSLTPAQRDVVRDWYDMTPAPTVKVASIALHEGTQAVKSVLVVSCEHVDPRRKAMLTQFSITKWGTFCDKVRQREHERAEELLAEAKEHKAPKVAKPTVTKKAPLLSELMNEYGVD